jgi:hypothetical protein
VIRKLLMGLALAAAAATAQAQLRAIPADAKRGTLAPLEAMAVTIDGRRVELAAGAQVRDARNLIVLPMSLRGSALVKYLLAPDGKLHRAWILSPQEAAQPDARR